MPADPTTPLFVRLPAADAERLDAAAASTGKSKRQLVSEAVRGHLADELVVGRVTLRQEEHEVLTAAEAAALLRVDQADVEDAAAAGQLPGRRIGGAWRFSRAALLAWLSGPGTSPSPAPPAGTTPPRS